MYEEVSGWQDFGTIEEYEKPQDEVQTTDVSAIDNVIYMEPFEATKGKEVTVPLRMKNTASIRGFQFICCAANYVGFQPKLPMCVDFLHFQHNINLTAQSYT